MSGNGGSNQVARRSRSVKRTFVLLRFCDFLRVPRSNVVRALESSGRIKEIEFNNNSTSAAIEDTLLNNFRDHLRREDLNR